MELFFLSFLWPHCMWLYSCTYVDNLAHVLFYICTNPSFFSGLLWTELHPLLNSTVWIPNLSRDCIWRWVIKDIIKVKWCHKVRPWSHRSGVFMRREETHCSLSVHRGKAKWGHSEKVAAISLRPPELWENTFLFKPPNLWYVVVAASTDQNMGIRRIKYCRPPM